LNIFTFTIIEQIFIALVTMNIPKFPFTLSLTHNTFAESFNDANATTQIKAVVSEELLSFLEQMETKSIPRIFSKDVFYNIIVPIRGKKYLFGTDNVVKKVEMEVDFETNETKYITTLTFPEGSIVHDVIAILKEYGDELFPYHGVDWTSAECVYDLSHPFCIKMTLTTKTFDCGDICMYITFSYPGVSSEPVDCANFIVDVRYTNPINHKFIIVNPFANAYRTGYNYPEIYPFSDNSSFNDLPSHSVYTSPYNFTITWNSKHINRPGYHPAQIQFDVNPNTGNIEKRFRFMQHNIPASHECRPSEIMWEQTVSGQTVQVLYSFKTKEIINPNSININISNNIDIVTNYFPLFAQLYPNHEFIHKLSSGQGYTLHCMSQMMNVLNDNDFQNILLGLPWLGIKKRVVIKLNRIRRKGYLSLLSKDILAIIFHFLFPDFSLSFLHKMIELNIAHLNNRENALI
jgi:hypothetical protein